MKAILLLTVTAIWCAHAVPHSRQPRATNSLTVMELIASYEYPAEEHYVTTPDGYNLKLHRIPHGKNPNNVKNKVVFLMHGVLCSSVDWVLTGPTQGLGFILADEGYDVWMGNARGNHESRNHTTFNPDKDSAFWQFSWHEIGSIDVPTMIDYVLEVTGQENLYHVGHSQGTTSFYVMMTTHPEYNAKVKAHFSLAPIAYMNHMTSPLMHIIAFWGGTIDLLFSLIGINEFLPSNAFMAMVGDILCGDGALTQILCTNALFAVCGFSPSEMNATILPFLTEFTPAGSSVKQFLHYAQEINSGAFRQYDFGVENLIKYGSFTPPAYELKHVSTPIYLMYSHNDWMSGEPDVIRLCEGLGDACAGKFLVSDNGFNHLDYLYGIDAPEIVYNRVISLMARH